MAQCSHLLNSLMGPPRLSLCLLWSVLWVELQKASPKTSENTAHLQVTFLVYLVFLFQRVVWCVEVHAWREDTQTHTTHAPARTHTKTRTHTSYEGHKQTHTYRHWRCVLFVLLSSPLQDMLHLCACHHNEEDEHDAWTTSWTLWRNTV